MLNTKKIVKYQVFIARHIKHSFKMYTTSNDIQSPCSANINKQKNM